MAQKLMLRKFSSQQILLMIYFGCTLVFTPFAKFSQVQGLTPISLGCLIYCCLNTLFGYGAYAEALNRWGSVKSQRGHYLGSVVYYLFAHLATISTQQILPPLN